MIQVSKSMTLSSTHQVMGRSRPAEPVTSSAFFIRGIPRSSSTFMRTTPLFPRARENPSPAIDGR